MRKKLMVIVALVMATISLLVATGASADAVYESGSQNLDIVLRVGYKVYNGAVYNEITAPHVSGHSTIVDVSHAKNYAITFQNSLGKTSYSSLVGSAFATIGANCASRAGLSLSATKPPPSTHILSARALRPACTATKCCAPFTNVPSPVTETAVSSGRSRS